MDKIREKVINFMEHNEYLSKLKNKQWYDMEDSLVNLVEEFANTKDDTYNTLNNVEKIALYQTVLKEYKDCCEWLNKRSLQGDISLKTLYEELKGWNYSEQEECFDFSYKNKDIILACYQADEKYNIDIYIEFYDKYDDYYAMTVDDIKKELEKLGVKRVRSDIWKIIY